MSRPVKTPFDTICLNMYVRLIMTAPFFHPVKVLLKIENFEETPKITEKKTSSKTTEIGQKIFCFFARMSFLVFQKRLSSSELQLFRSFRKDFFFRMA